MEALKVEKSQLLRTEIGIELNRMEKIVDLRLAGYSVPKNFIGKEGTLIQIIKRHSRGKIDDREMKKIEEAVEFAVSNNCPINISFLWACSGLSPSRMKFIQGNINYPRLGDVWALYWLKMINEKIKLVHSPGVRFIIVDELPLLEILGLPRPSIDRRHKIMKELAKRVDPSLEIIEMPDFSEVVGRIEAKEPDPSEIYAILTSQECQLPEKAIDFLYNVRQKPWGEIRSFIPDDVWDAAKECRMKMNKIGEARKRTGFVENFLGGVPYIDGCIVEKGRWCPDIWSSAFPQHGGTVLEENGRGRFSVRCLPEYRLVESHEPVYIGTDEFDSLVGFNSGERKEFVFFWRNE